MKDMMKTLENEQQFYELQKDSKVTVFVFSANWCPDCVFIKPFLPELMNKYPDYQFIYVDRDEHLDTCINHDILGIPSFVAFKDNQEIGRFVSKLRKTKEEIDKFLGEL